MHFYPYFFLLLLLFPQFLYSENIPLKKPLNIKEISLIGGGNLDISMRNLQDVKEADNSFGAGGGLGVKITNTRDINAVVYIGGIGASYKSYFLDTIESTESKTFGYAVLNPGSRSLSLNLNGKLLSIANSFPELPKRWWTWPGLNGSLQITGSTWSNDGSSEAVTIIDGLLGLCTGIDGKWKENELLLSFDLGWVFRSLAGDIIQEDDFRKKCLGTGQYFFNGLQLGTTFNINSINVSLNVPILFGHVKGLTNGQIVFKCDLNGKIKIFSKERDDPDVALSK